MSVYFGRSGPRWPRLGQLGFWLGTKFIPHRFRRKNVHLSDSAFAKSRIAVAKARLELGKTLYFVGLGAAGHNSGVSLVRASKKAGIEVLSNDEEERFSGIKHCQEFPHDTLRVLETRLAELDLDISDIHAWLLTWEYSSIGRLAIKAFFEELPFSRTFLRKEAMRTWDFFEIGEAARQSPARLRQHFDMERRPHVIAMPHHDNHAAMSFVLSPFAQADTPVMLSVIDGFGDQGAISLYLAERGQIRKLRQNQSIPDSLGAFYTVISSTKGGWTPLSSEGRYMGAAAWGDQSRLTNPYYARLKQVFHFDADGQVSVNRAMINWHLGGEMKPYGRLLEAIIGPPIPHDRMWNPDEVLDVKTIQHSEMTLQRVDIAAATQLVFEDVIFHIIGHLIRTTGSDKLVMSGGTALNCLANMKLLDRFDVAWYRRNLGKHTRLHIWVPPAPGDAGVTIGAACNFALQSGAKPGKSMKHAFYCGLPPSQPQIDAALRHARGFHSLDVGDINHPQDLESIADFVAFAIAKDAVIAIYQGPAETGPRALGHRSILANACNADTLENINRLVKFREPIRPLAPMVTMDAAKKFFELSEGASDDDYNAYNYMVLTVPAKPDAIRQIPAVVHRDGTARIQIVRRESDPLCYNILRRIGVRLGAEVAVNTSFNVAGPIAQTPAQALQTMTKAKALTGLIMVDSRGKARFVYRDMQVGPDPAALLEEWRNPAMPVADNLPTSLPLPSEGAQDTSSSLF